MTAADPVLADAWRALAQVHDPEIPVLDVIEMGIVRDVTRGPNGLEVTITPTYTGCPATHMITQDIRRALAGHGFDHVDVKLRYDPPWSTDQLSESARVKLKASGIAPPVGRSGGKRQLFGADPEVACPRCGSLKTHKVSEFGSTACKALWACDACLEPFDYFKCI